MPLYCDMEHVARRAEALEREAVRDLRLLAEARAVAGPEARSDDGEHQGDDDEHRGNVSTSGDNSDEPGDELDRCPRCGVPIMSVSMVDPSEVILAPCGHRVPPDTIDRGRRGDRGE